MARRWRVLPTAAARRDIGEILAWTADNFGTRQARIYQGLIAAALQDLEAGPDAPAMRWRQELGRDIWAMRIARAARPVRHVMFCRCGDDEAGASVVVLRILHDAMDPTLHLPADEPT